MSEARDRWRRDNKDRIRAKNREWREANRDKIREANLKWGRANKDRTSLYKAKKYDLTPSEYLELLKIQDNKCAICEQPETKLMYGTLMRLCIDHNHTTNSVRLLLCSRCNAVLGLVNDDTHILEAMIVYLEVIK